MLSPLINLENIYCFKEFKQKNQHNNIWQFRKSSKTEVNLKHFFYDAITFLQLFFLFQMITTIHKKEEEWMYDK